MSSSARSSGKYAILHMSRPKGGEGTSDCVQDVLVEVLNVLFLTWNVVISTFLRVTIVVIYRTMYMYVPALCTRAC